MNAKLMMGNRPSLGLLAERYPFVSPKSRVEGKPPRAVLAVYPAAPTLELAQELALDGALCVIPSKFDDVRHWITRARAMNLAAPDELPSSLLPVDPKAAEVLQGLCEFGGHNEFLGGDEKEHAIQGLRQIAALPRRPSTSELRQYVLSTGWTGNGGVERLCHWYESILHGKRLKGDSGRYI